MNTHHYLHLASLLHDIGKFRQRATERYTKHQIHSHEFVTEDFAHYFAPCGDTFKNAILNHHTDGNNLIEKQVILADRLSATEREDEERESEDFVVSSLVSILSRLKGADKEHRYKLTALNFDRNTIIPVQTADVNKDDYNELWECFKNEFGQVTVGKQYTPADYQTIVALLHKYTSRMPSATPWEKSEEKTIPDISLYDHLRTTAAIAACIGRELTDTDDIDKLLTNPKESDHTICALIKGDISGIQNFLYHIQSGGASNQLRSRSFYLQLLTEAIAHWVLKQLDLPITNLILASGGHFFILAPHTVAKDKLDILRRTISDKLWKLHNGDISCILAGIPVNAHDFNAENFPKKWDAVSKKVQQRKQQKWSEIEANEMFENLFEPQENKNVNWEFEELGRQLRNVEYMTVFEVSDISDIPNKPTWRDAIKAFGLDIRIHQNADEISIAQPQATHAIVYRIGSTDFLSDDILQNFQSDNIDVSYNFRPFHPVISSKDDGTIADYDYLSEASEGVQWFGALRMDVDDLGAVFIDKLEKATISRQATLSEAMRLFFEGYVPQICKEYNENRDKEILELIYAGGDDLFLVGGWSALPEIAEKIRTEFHDFVTGNHVTLSGGIAIEHKKFPLYQFAAQSGAAEDKAKDMDGKNAITLLRKPMKWEDYTTVSEWHQEFMDALTGGKQLPRDILTRLSQIYSSEELKGYRWAWRSLYYFHRLLERNKSQSQFINKLKNELNNPNEQDLKEFIQVITRWTALSIRKS